MNKRRRDLLTALQPAVDFALRAHGKRPEADASIPGFTFKPRADANTPADLYIYGVIGGGGWFSDGIAATDVAEALKVIGPGPVNVKLNSPGGDVFDGVAIHSLLASHPGYVTVNVDGHAASAASFIMLAGDHIRGPKNAFVMLHDAMTAPYGNSATLRTAADLLDKVSGTMAEMYADRAGEDAAFWREVMTRNGEDGTWYNGTEAHEAGLFDEVTTPTKGEDPEDEEYAVARLLSGWEATLGTRARAFLETHKTPEPTEGPEPIKPADWWNPQQFAENLKGVFS
jgi:ATP-dependent protease ClpP protease subunit